MSQGRITLGFKPEVLEAYGARPPRRMAGALLYWLAFVASLLLVLAALVLSTDLEELLLPRTVIVRGNRLSDSASVLDISGLPGKLGLRSLLPATHAVPEERSRWIRSISTKMMFGRRMLLSVDERMPVLPLEVGSQAYWICSDGEIVTRDPLLDVDGSFVALNKLPLVKMEDSGIDADYDVADMLMLTAGCCREMLDGRILCISVLRSGEINLNTDKGLNVQLGIPGEEQQLRLRMSALAKAIRISDGYKDAVGIDMRNGKVAYLRTKASE